MKNILSRAFKSKTLYLFVFAIAVLVYLLQAIQPSFSNFNLTTPSGKTQPLTSPGFMESHENGVYRLSGTLTMNRFSSSLLRFIPDDEIYTLSINQRPVDLSMIPAHERKDYSKGFTYELKDYLHEGENQIDIIYMDQGGLMGIVISAEHGGATTLVIYAIFTFIALLLATKLANACKLSTPIKCLFIAALLIRILYFSVTTADVREHDLGDHIGYTEYLSKHWMPPPVDYAIGGAFFHPPLYYYTGAIVYKATQLI